MIEILIALVITIILHFIVGKRVKKNQWNNGHCKICNNKLELFDRDSQKGEGYQCRNGHKIWF